MDLIAQHTRAEEGLLADLLGRSMGHRMRSPRSSEAPTPSARGLSDFRRLFPRVRRRPSAKQRETHAPNFESSGATLKGRARLRKRIEPMQRGSSVLLRSIFSAAIVCAVLRAATLSGADRGGSLPNGNIRETGPILVRSISTIKSPVSPATRDPISESAPAPTEGNGEAALHACANVALPIHDHSKPAHKPPGIGALAFLNPAIPRPRSMLFRQA
jgi:hypothetical protein